MSQALIGAVSTQGGVRAFIVVEVLPFLQLVVEATYIFDHHTRDQTVEFLLIDAVRTFDFTIKTRCSGLDINVVDTLILKVPVELRCKLRTVDPEGAPSE